MSDRFYLRTSSAIGPLWYADGAGSPSWTMERLAAYPFPSALAARLWRKGLGLAPADCRVVRVGPKRPAAPASADAAALRKVLAEILAGPSNEPPRWRDPGAAPLHAHRVPGRWDRDGSPCAWCALWARAEALVAPPAEKAPPAAPVAPGRADGTPDGCEAVQRHAARPTGSQAPDPGGLQVGDVWELLSGGERFAIAAGPSPDRVSVRRVSALGLGREEGPWLVHDTGGLRLVSRAGKPWPPEAP